MLDHVSITVSDLARATPFWDAIMQALDVPCVVRNERQLGYGLRNRPDDDGHSYFSVFVSRGPRLAADNRLGASARQAAWRSTPSTRRGLPAAAPATGRRA